MDFDPLARPETFSQVELASDMKTLRPVVLPLALAVAGAAAAVSSFGEQTYQFNRTPAPQVGWTYVRAKDHALDGRQKFTVDGKVMDDTKGGFEVHYQCKVEVLAVDKGRVTSEKLSFSKASANRGGEAQDLGLAGKTVKVDLTGPRPQIAPEGGGDLKGEQKGFLASEFAGTGPARRRAGLEGLLPERAVAVHDTWELPLEAVLPLLDLDWDEFKKEKFVVTATLEKVGPLYGTTCGTVSLKLDGKPQTMDGVPLTESVLHLAATLEFPLDGAAPYRSLDVNLELNVQGKGAKDGKERSVEYVRKVRFVEAWKPVE